MAWWSTRRMGSQGIGAVLPRTLPRFARPGLARFAQVWFSFVTPTRSSRMILFHYRVDSPAAASAYYTRNGLFRSGSARLGRSQKDGLPAPLLMRYEVQGHRRAHRGTDLAICLLERHETFAAAGRAERQGPAITRTTRSSRQSGRAEQEGQQRRRGELPHASGR